MIYPRLIKRLSDLLCTDGDEAMSTLCASLGSFYRVPSQPMDNTGDGSVIPRQITLENGNLVQRGAYITCQCRTRWVSRAVWQATLTPHMSRVATDVMWFSAHGTQLVHHYRVVGDCVSHSSLRGPYMEDLRPFTNRASAANHGQVMDYVSDVLPGRPDVSATTDRETDDDPPAWKAARAVTGRGSPPRGSSAADLYSAPPAPRMSPVPVTRRQELSLPRFAFGPGA